MSRRIFVCFAFGLLSESLVNQAGLELHGQERMTPIPLHAAGPGSEEGHSTLEGENTIMTDGSKELFPLCQLCPRFPAGAVLDSAHAHAHGREALLLPALQQTLPAEAATYRAPEEGPRPQLRPQCAPMPQVR